MTCGVVIEFAIGSRHSERLLQICDYGCQVFERFVWLLWKLDVLVFIHRNVDPSLYSDEACQSSTYCFIRDIKNPCCGSFQVHQSSYEVQSMEASSVWWDL